MKWLNWTGGLIVLGLIVCTFFIGSGAYNVAADDPHWALTRSVIEKARTASIERRSADIQVPPLGDAALVASGAGNYEAMCAGCHLKPGVAATEMSRGLYPAPPNFAMHPLENPASAFWVIKHGIKMTGMPAWGKSMEDEYVWGLVAFMKELPGMPADRYRELVETSGGHRHGGTEGSVATDVPAEDDHSKAPPHQH